MRELFKQLGGQVAVSEMTGVCPTAVAHWIRRNTLPIKHWSAILVMADRKGINLSVEDIYNLLAKQS